MATGTNIKDRCRRCYTRLKDSSSFHHKFWYSQSNQRVYNIYKRRPYRYRDLIVRYLYIHLPDNEGNSLDQYSHAVCSTCAASLNKLESTVRAFQQVQKLLRSKFRKTSQIVHYQLEKRMKQSVHNENQQEKLNHAIQPKRQSKRKGAPKHIDQTMNNNKKPTASVQLIVKIPSFEQEELDETSMSNKRTSLRRKTCSINEIDEKNPKKKFKRLTKDDDYNDDDDDDDEEAAYNCLNLVKPSILTDISTNKNSTPLKLPTISGSSTSNSRTLSSVKGNHIERIADSLRSVRIQ